ncbi:MAG TPA: YfhO family protein [Polyangiaceae bacterium]|nr:YfhO family protein [Polyangiaceae bacterium]
MLSRHLERWRDAVAVALVGLVPFGAYWRLWVRGPRAEYLYGDTCGLYWPDLVYLYRAFTHLQIPLWNPFERGGVSTLSEPEAGVLYPLNWLMVAVGAVSGGMPFGMIEVKACLHLAIGGVAMFALLRRRGLSAPAAALGGIVYELGPYTAGNAYFAIVWPQAWLPLLMLGTDWLVDGGGVFAAMTVAAAAFLVLVAGSPPTAFYCALVAIPYFVLRAALAARRDGWRPWLERNGRPLLWAVLLTAVSCYPSVRGTFEAMRASIRAVRTFAYVSESPLPLHDWLGLVLRAGSHVHVYVGIPSILLAAVGIARWRSRAEAALFAAMAAFGGLMMLGSATPVLGWMYTAAPPFRLFRICVRYVFLLQVAVAVLAAHGLEALPELRPRRFTSAFAASLALPLTFVGAIVLVAALHTAAAPRLADDMNWLLLGGGVTLVLAVAAALRPASFPAVGAVLALLVAVDLGVTSHRASVARAGRFDPTSTLVSDQWVARMQSDGDTARVYDEFGLNWRAGSRFGLRDLRGYVEPLTQQRVSDLYARIGKSPELLGLFNVRWILHSGHPVHGMTHNFVKSLDGVPGVTPRDGAVFEADEPAPRAYWVKGARIAATVDDAIAHLGDLDVHGELVLVEGDVGSIPPERRMDRAPRQAAAFEEGTYSSLRFSVDAPADGYLVVNETWFPGWEATIDGRATPVLRGNVIMQVVDVPAGHHVIALRFRPGYVLYPLGLALVAWMATLGWALHARRKALSKRAPDAPGPTPPTD